MRELLAGKAPAHRDLIKACGGIGGHRLAAYVYRLRKKEWPIYSKPIAGGCSANPPVEYSIPPGWRPHSPQLGLPL